MSIKTPWAPVAFDWYADEEVAQTPMGPVLWPWLLGRVIRGQGVVSDSELDGAAAVANLQLVALGEALRDALLSDPRLDIAAWMATQAEATFAGWRKPRSSRKQPLMVPAYSERDLGGRNKSGGYGRNLQVKRGLTPKGFREWMGRHTKIEVVFDSSPAVAPPTSPTPGGPSHLPPGNSSPPPPPSTTSSTSAPSAAGEGYHQTSGPPQVAAAAARLAAVFGAYWPGVELRADWWQANLPILLRAGEQAVAQACANARTRGAKHPNYVLACLERAPLPPADPPAHSTRSGSAGPARGAVPTLDQWTGAFE